MGEKQYITTVANAMLRDTESDMIVMRSKTLLNSTITFNVEEKEIRGGELNKLLYAYNCGRTGEVKLEDARYEPAMIALNCGTTIQNQVSNVYVFEETVELDNLGNGTVAEQTPIAGVKAYVQTSDGLITTKSFNGIDFSMGDSFANQTVKVTYQYNEDVDVITIDGNNFSKTYELVLEIKVFDDTGLKEKVQWIFPKFKPSGNFEMALTSEAPVTSSMTGKILSTEDDIYGYKKTIPLKKGATYTAITADTSKVELASGTNHALTIYGLRGGIYSPTVLKNAELTFVSDNESIAAVSNTGVVEYVGSGTAEITITSSTGLKDVISVVCK